MALGWHWFSWSKIILIVIVIIADFSILQVSFCCTLPSQNSYLKQIPCSLFFKLWGPDADVSCSTTVLNTCATSMTVPEKADLSEVCSNSNESVHLLLLLIFYTSVTMHVTLQVLKPLLVWIKYVLASYFHWLHVAATLSLAPRFS